MNLATFILVSVPLAIQFFEAQFRATDHAKTLEELVPELGVPRIRSYDFIVVGGGTAGCVVAGRLSEAEDGRYSVLLLEAGGNPVPQVDVPAFIPLVADSREINYFFKHVPQPHAGEDHGGVFELSFGRMLGGSGSHNHMLHNRGSPRDFDNWANITGDGSWEYNSVVEYFKKYEDFVGSLLDEGDEENYGHDGPLRVNSTTNPVLPLWLAAGQELGYDAGDPNGRQRESFNPIHVTMDRGRRVSAYTGFIRPFEEERPNLTVLRYSDVHKILIDEVSKAYGVAFTRHGIAQRAYAKREVILSGGSVRSPLLLMKSGIGPADVLGEAGISVKVDRPGVGLNLGEHVALYVGRIHFNDSSLLPRIRDGDEAELERYHAAGEGQLAETGALAQALLVSSRAKADGEHDWPDIQLTLGLRLGSELGPPPEGQDFINLYVTNGRPSSRAHTRTRGSVRLNGTAWRAGERDDQRLAIIDPQLLIDPSDNEVLVEGLKIGLRVFENTTAFESVGARFPDESHAHPECVGLDFPYRSDEYWRCVVRRTASGWNHYVGTCSMGKIDDPLAVVDSKLRVIGVEGLRVVDASVMPVVPNSNINAPTLMVAEKGAAEILKGHGI